MSSKYARSDIKLREIEELIQEGKMDNANRQLELLKKKKDFSQDHQLKYLLFKSQINIKMKKFEEGLKLARNAMEKCQKYGTPLLKVDACIREAEALEGLKIFNESLDVIDKGNRILKEIKIESDSSITTRKATLLYLRGKIHIAKDDLDQALTLFQQSLSLRKEIGDSFLIAESLNGIGRIYSSKDIHEKALDYFKKSISLLKKVGITKELAWTFWNIGSIYCKKGSLDKSLEYFQLSNEHFDKIGDKEGNGQALYCMSATTHDKGELNLALEYQRLSLNLYKDLGYKSEITKSLIKIGFIYISRGELDLALEYLQQSLVKFDEIHARYKAWALVGIGEICRLKGELDQALIYFEQSLALRKESSYNHEIAECLYYIGKILQQQGKVDQAWDYLEESLTLLDEPNHNLFITGILLDLVSLIINKGYYDLSKKYLEQLKKIDDQEKNMIINQRYRMAKAFVLKTSSRVRNKALVQEIFQQIVEEEIVDHRITVSAMYNLCESLLDELRAYGEEAVMLEAKALAKNLTTLAHKQFSSLLAIDALILQAKLAMVEGTLSDAEEFLVQAEALAEGKNLGVYIISKVSTERRNLEDKYDEWQKLIQENASFKDRLEHAQLKDYLNEALKLARLGKDHTCE